MVSCLQSIGTPFTSTTKCLANKEFRFLMPPPNYLETPTRACLESGPFIDGNVGMELVQTYQAMYVPPRYESLFLENNLEP
jgi:hypothetical protein